MVCFVRVPLSPPKAELPLELRMMILKWSSSCGVLKAVCLISLGVCVRVCACLVYLSAVTRVQTHVRTPCTVHLGEKKVNRQPSVFQRPPVLAPNPLHIIMTPP